MDAMGTKAQRAEATRTALTTAAKRLFTERGYAGVGTEDIVRAAHVTRGALYHHFADKRALFRTVHEQVEQDAVSRITAAMAGIEDPIELLAAGGRAFFDLCEDPRWTRIPLIDAPSVLGWAEWREIDMRYSLGLVSAGLEGGMEAGVIRRAPIRPLAHLLVAGLGELGLTIATADDRRAAREEAEVTLVGLLQGLRA